MPAYLLIFPWCYYSNIRARKMQERAATSSKSYDFLIFHMFPQCPRSCKAPLIGGSTCQTYLRKRAFKTRLFKTSRREEPLLRSSRHNAGKCIAGAERVGEEPRFPAPRRFQDSLGGFEIKGAAARRFDCRFG